MRPEQHCEPRTIWEGRRVGVPFIVWGGGTPSFPQNFRAPFAGHLAERLARKFLFKLVHLISS
jgi:hypothetical protein